MTLLGCVLAMMIDAAVMYRKALISDEEVLLVRTCYSNNQGSYVACVLIARSCCSYFNPWRMVAHI